MTSFNERIKKKTFWEKEKMLVTSIFFFFFPTMLLKSLFCRIIKSRDCVGKGWNNNKKYNLGIEDEFHAFFFCETFKETTEICLRSWYRGRLTRNNLSYILRSHNPEIIKKSALYVTEFLENICIVHHHEYNIVKPNHVIFMAMYNLIMLYCGPDA